MRAVGRAVAVGLTGLVMLAACSPSQGPPHVSPTIGTAFLPTTTTNPYAVPAVIDAAYVNRVLAGLDAVDGDIIRLAVLAQRLPPDLVDRLKALYGQETVSLQLQALAQDSAEGFKGAGANPGNRRTTVSELLTAGPKCIFAHVARDYGPIANSPEPNISDQWIALVPLDPIRDPNRYNATGWMYIYDGFEEGHVMPKNPCAG